MYRIVDGPAVVAVAVAAAVGVAAVAGRAAVEEAMAAHSRVAGRADTGLDNSSGVAEHLGTEADQLGQDRAGRSRDTSSRNKLAGHRLDSSFSV